MLRLVDLRAGARPLGEVAAELRRTSSTPDTAIVERVLSIIDRVRTEGDAAIFDLTRELEGCDLEGTGLEVAATEIETAREQLSFDLFEALEESAGRIEAFQRHLLSSIPERTVFERSGIYVDDLRRSVRRAGLYAPGGRYSYPSTVLMTAIPAKVAGSGEVCLCVPPDGEGGIPAVTLAAAALAGVDRVFKVGGAQAIAAMAYGTETIPAAEVVAGPGNQYVAAAKREVFGKVGIDSIAGPSEVFVVADRDADPQWVAIDVLAQAEHGPGGSFVIAVLDDATAERVGAAIESEVAADGRVEVSTALAEGGAIVICNGLDEAVALSNEFAPEHLQLMVEDPGSLLDGVVSAGAVFLGYGTPTAYGDYVAGPNHVLPTGGAARYASALSVENFLRRMHAVQLSPMAIETVGMAAETLADAEGLKAHSESVRRRRIWREAQQ